MYLRNISNTNAAILENTYAARTITVPSVKKPKRKYAPNAECAKKIGVRIATSQLHTYATSVRTHIVSTPNLLTKLSP